MTPSPAFGREAHNGDASERRGLGNAKSPEVKIEEKGPELGFGGRVKNALRGKRKAPTGA